MALVRKQAEFSVMVANLILTAHSKGYLVTLGHAYRCDDCAVGLHNSNHKSRLAIDLNFFEKIGETELRHITDTEKLTELGEIWESWGGAWGGRFKNRDGNHFSLEHNGVR